MHREDRIEPIYRNTTLNTAIVDFYRKKIFLYTGNPSHFKEINTYIL